MQTPAPFVRADLRAVVFPWHVFTTIICRHSPRLRQLPILVTIILRRSANVWAAINYPRYCANSALANRVDGRRTKQMVSFDRATLVIVLGFVSLTMPSKQIALPARPLAKAIIFKSPPSNCLLLMRRCLTG